MKKLIFLFYFAVFICAPFHIYAKENKSPAVGEITWQQLHKIYEETPHKYLLNLTASDPESNLPLIYNWTINCGYFAGSINSNHAEWHYNVPGECIEAKVTVSVTDALGAKTQRTQYVFSEIGGLVSYTEYPTIIEETKTIPAPEPDISTPIQNPIASQISNSENKKITEPEKQIKPKTDTLVPLNTAQEMDGKNEPKQQQNLKPSSEIDIITKEIEEIISKGVDASLSSDYETDLLTEKIDSSEFDNFISSLREDSVYELSNQKTSVFLGIKNIFLRFFYFCKQLFNKSDEKLSISPYIITAASMDKEIKFVSNKYALFNTSRPDLVSISGNGKVKFIAEPALNETIVIYAFTPDKKEFAKAFFIYQPAVKEANVFIQPGDIYEKGGYNEIELLKFDQTYDISTILNVSEISLKNNADPELKKLDEQIEKLTEEQKQALMDYLKEKLKEMASALAKGNQKLEKVIKIYEELMKWWGMAERAGGYSELDEKIKECIDKFTEALKVKDSLVSLIEYCKCMFGLGGDESVEFSALTLFCENFGSQGSLIIENIPTYIKDRMAFILDKVSKGEFDIIKANKNCEIAEEKIKDIKKIKEKIDALEKEIEKYEEESAVIQENIYRLNIDIRERTKSKQSQERYEILKKNLQQIRTAREKISSLILEVNYLKETIEKEMREIYNAIDEYKPLRIQKCEQAEQEYLDLINWLGKIYTKMKEYSINIVEIYDITVHNAKDAMRELEKQTKYDCANALKFTQNIHSEISELEDPEKILSPTITKIEYYIAKTNELLSLAKEIKANKLMGQRTEKLKDITKYAEDIKKNFQKEKKELEDRIKVMENIILQIENTINKDKESLKKINIAGEPNNDCKETQERLDHAQTLLNIIKEKLSNAKNQSKNADDNINQTRAELQNLYDEWIGSCNQIRAWVIYDDKGKISQIWAVNCDAESPPSPPYKYYGIWENGRLKN